MTLEQRHRCMSRIHSTGTKPEMKVRRWLWSHGYRYRLNVKSVPGKPDIVMRPYRTAIFVNGCFWHGHNVKLSPTLPTASEHDTTTGNSECCKIPTSNREFWVAKIRRNQQRDLANYQLLQENGWHVIVVWECQLTAKRLEQTMREVELLLGDNILSLYKSRKPAAYPTEEDSPLPMAAEYEEMTQSFQ